MYDETDRFHLSYAENGLRDSRSHKVEPQQRLEGVQLKPDQSLIVVRHHPKALDLAVLNVPLPAQEGVAVIQAELSGIGAVAELRGCRHDHRHLLPPFDRAHEEGV
jgi:hypothetical protein